MNGFALPKPKIKILIYHLLTVITKTKIYIIITAPDTILMQ